MKIHSKRLRIARERKNLTQIQVKEITKGKIHNKTLSGYENEVSDPDIESLRVLAELYEVTTDWLIGNTDKPNILLSDTERELYENIRLPTEQLKKLFKITKALEGLSEEEQDMTMDFIISFLRARKDIKEK